MADVFIYINSVFFFGMGIVALINPAHITGYFSLRDLSLDLRNEVRAVYGGFGIAIAAMLVVAVNTDTLRPGVVLTVALALFGMASGRLVSLAIERRIGPYPLLFLAVELILGSTLIFAFVNTASGLVTFPS